MIGTWAPEACMNPKTAHRFATPLSKGTTPDWPGRTVLAHTPMSLIIQHMYDRSTKIMVRSRSQALARPRGGSHAAVAALLPGDAACIVVLLAD